jgi:hypothetical protein
MWVQVISPLLLENVNVVHYSFIITKCECNSLVSYYYKMWVQVINPVLLENVDVIH